MSARAKAISNLYKRHKISIDGVRQAVSDGVISAEEFFEITGEPFDAPAE